MAGNTYEARLYANDGYTLIAKTPPFTVVANTGQSTPAKLYYYHNDHLGTPQAMTNETGTVVWRATYDPFGWAAIATSTVTNNLRFAGQYYDQETGLHYNWHRYYDPKAGRYITSDPIGLRGGLNTYAYVRNNPLRWIDPTGLEWIFKGWYAREHSRWWSHWRQLYAYCYETCTKLTQLKEAVYEQWRPIPINTPQVPTYEPSNSPDIVNALFDIYETIERAKNQGSMSDIGSTMTHPEIGQQLCSQLPLPPEAKGKCCSDK